MCKGEQEARASCSIVMASVLRANGVADVPCVTLDVWRRSDSQANVSQLFAGIAMDHAEVVSRNLVDLLDAVLDKLQFELFVTKTREGERLH